MRLLFALLALFAAAVCIAYELQDGKLSVSSIDGSSRISKTFTSKAPISVDSPLALDADEILRIVFTIRDSAGETARPRQVFAVATDVKDASRSETFVLPVKKSSGKATLSLRMDRLPAALLTSSGQVSLTLLLGGEEDGLAYPLPTLTLPAVLLKSAAEAPSARTVREEQEGFFGWQERHHTFSVPASETMPPAIVSVVVAAASVAVPWIVLLGLVSGLGLRLSSLTTARSLLLASLVYCELLAARYWIGGPSMTLFKMVPWLLAGGVATLLTGRHALGELRKERL